MPALSTILVIGAGAVVLAFVLLALLVGRDLGPAARLRYPQRVLLAAALGSGVIAFSLKLAIISGLSLVDRDGRALATAPPIAVPIDNELGLPSPIPVTTVWEALPWAAPEPADNPTTPAKVRLGQRLFEDKLLSRDGTVACASCHDLGAGAGAEPRAVSTGVGDQRGRRNAPTVYNAAFQARLFWDGRARSLEEQALGPLANPIEMGNDDLDALVRRLASDASYRDAFAQAFGALEPITKERIADAIAAFERTLVTPDAPYDRFVRGDASALTPQQLRGMALFESVGCINCHAGPAFSRASFLAPEHGRAAFRLFPVRKTDLIAKYGLDQDHGLARGGEVGIWRVPSLRNVALTAPYFHNGGVSDLTEAVRIMATVQLGRVIRDHGPAEPVIAWDARQKRVTRFTPDTISETEIADIVAFLHALTSDTLSKISARGDRGGETR